ncbi:hypothetical protein HGRIS_013173 [Hohenbuehelia grisea]|uniref:Dol-P-Man:Man(5)GlcNAc(2)-PP-Dol alpha-1,3-mannosyltransferase n=1 Tax=Hohenbuehelia grisea TaxID=104357 RepID=A0ABR3IUK3_9AGAR
MIAGLPRRVQTWLTHPKYFRTIACLVVFGDALLTLLIVHFVSFTEIDWETYMVQAEVALKGETTYSKITGPTGPAVYPAGHIHIHSLLHSITSCGKDVFFAQHLYAALYVLSLSLTCGIYGKAGTMPNWILFLLPLSKRLHSIFVLRLFNDAWAVVAMEAAILAYQTGMDDVGTLLFSAALSVKMSILLYLPGLLVILFKRRGLASTLRLLATIISFQGLVAMKYLRADALAYLSSAFDLTRVFLFKWTVNWRMLGEELFLSPTFAKGLLVAHASTLIAFGLYRWCQADGGVQVVLRRGFVWPTRPAGLAPVTPDYVATVLLTSNLIGILFARSLHYQFYSWYVHQVPFLAWKTRLPVPMKIALLAAIEYAWNVYPSTSLSSSVLLASNSILLLGIWLG